MHYTPTAKQPLTPLELRVAYLGWVFTTSGDLPLGNVAHHLANETAEKLHLGAVYTALATQTLENAKPEAQNPATADAPELAQTVLGSGSALSGRGQSLSALEQLNHHARLVLLGDPGSGKSTFVNFVALCLSGETLGRADANLECLTEGVAGAWAHGALLPVRVVVRDFAARGLPPPGLPATAQHLWGFIQAELKASTLEAFADALHATLLTEGGLLLLDGLDEVPTGEAQRAQIKQAVDDFAVVFGKVRILATSRTYAYQQLDWKLAGFAAATLTPFAPAQVEAFVQRWYTHLAVLRGWPDAERRAADLLGALRQSPRLSELAGRPLLLTLMAVLHAWRGGALPERREALYAAAVDLLLDQWERPKQPYNAQGLAQPQSSLAQWLKVDRDAVRRLLNELACHAHAAQPVEQNGTADVPEDLLVRRLLKLSLNADVNPADLVDYLSQRAGVLLPRGAGVYTFPHRTFQEYLAACHLTDHDFPRWLAQLAREDWGRWREVALLAAAKAARGAESYTWLLVNTLCPKEVDMQLGAKAAEADWVGALLAGEVLLETANLQWVDAPEMPRLKRVRQWLVRLLATSALTPQLRARTGEVLAGLGDPRAGVAPASREELRRMQFCYVPPGPFIMGEVAGTGADPKMINNTLQKGYWLGRYPVTVGQWRVFVAETQHTPEDADSLRDPVNRPVRWVSWYEALKFCEWLTASFGNMLPKDYVFTLPSEAEWEKAARGGDTIPAQPLLQDLRAALPAAPEIILRHNPQPKRLYPWGDEFELGRANVHETGIGDTSSVGCFAKGISPYGCQDMVGNVWEWMSTLWENEAGQEFTIPYSLFDGRENLQAPKQVARVVRGSMFYYSSLFAKCSYRNGEEPPYCLNTVGFRVVAAHRKQ